MTNNDVIVERLDNIREDIKELKEFFREQQKSINNNTIEVEKLKAKIKAVFILLGTTGTLGVGGIITQYLGIF